MNKKFQIVILSVFFAITGFLILADKAEAQECNITQIVFNPSGTQASDWFSRRNRESVNRFTVTLAGNGNCGGKVLQEVTLVNTQGVNDDVEALNDEQVIFSPSSNQIVFIFVAGEEGCAAGFGSSLFNYDCNLELFVRSEGTPGGFWSSQASRDRGRLSYNCESGFNCDGSITFQLIGISGGRISGQDVPLPPPGGPVPGPGPGGPIPGEDVEVELNIPNPIAAESLIDLAKAIGKFLFQIAIPIAVIIIIYAGLLFLTSGGNKEKITKARTALWYAVVGLAIILIGQGFFTLIKSILNLGG